MNDFDILTGDVPLLKLSMNTDSIKDILSFLYSETEKNTRDLGYLSQKVTDILKYENFKKLEKEFKEFKSNTDNIIGKYNSEVENFFETSDEKYFAMQKLINNNETQLHEELNSRLSKIEKKIEPVLLLGNRVQILSERVDNFLSNSNDISRMKIFVDLQNKIEDIEKLVYNFGEKLNAKDLEIDDKFNTINSRIDTIYDEFNSRKDYINEKMEGLNSFIDNISEKSNVKHSKKEETKNTRKRRKEKSEVTIPIIQKTNTQLKENKIKVAESKVSNESKVLNKVKIEETIKSNKEHIEEVDKNEPINFENAGRMKVFISERRSPSSGNIAANTNNEQNIVNNNTSKNIINKIEPKTEDIVNKEIKEVKEIKEIKVIKEDNDDHECELVNDSNKEEYEEEYEEEYDENAELNEIKEVLNNQDKRINTLYLLLKDIDSRTNKILNNTKNENREMFDEIIGSILERVNNNEEEIKNIYNTINENDDDTAIGQQHCLVCGRKTHTARTSTANEMSRLQSICSVRGPSTPSGPGAKVTLLIGEKSSHTARLKRQAPIQPNSSRNLSPKLLLSNA